MEREVDSKSHVRGSRSVPPESSDQPATSQEDEHRSHCNESCPQERVSSCFRDWGYNLDADCVSALDAYSRSYERTGP
jgi:hypothetical protein